MNRRRAIGRGLGALAIATWLGFVALQGWYFGHVLYYVEHNPETTAFMQLRIPPAAESKPGKALEYEWVDYEDISIWLKRAVVAAEDARFMQHNGFDWRAIYEAFKANLAAEGIVRGGSTISQQLAKNLFLSPAQTYVRKAQEAIITIMIEATMSKRRILELYLNLIEWGDRVFGAAAAAENYYNTSAAALSRWQSAMLAARIPMPRYYDGRGVTDYLIERASDIYRWSAMVRIPKASEN